jgi:very-short-patch-repair endonuclease
MNLGLEETVKLVLANEGYEFKQEYEAIPNRRYKYDFALIKENILIEVQGSQWVKGGHNTGKGLERDYEKCNLAQIHGWRVLQYGTSFIREQPFEILEDIKRLIQGYK